MNDTAWLDILQTNTLSGYLQILEKNTGKVGVIAKLKADQTKQWRNALSTLGLRGEPSATELRTACQSNLALLNQIIVETIGTFDWEPVIQQLRQHIPNQALRGYFLRQECLEAMVRQCPPQRTVAAAGYKTIDEYLKHESVYLLLAAARFTESADWMKHYVQQYRTVTPKDFSDQPIKFLLLDPTRWWEYAASFAAKKKHNFSHLKEAGVVFWYPDESFRTDHTQLHRLLLMLLHYIYEVHFYSAWFQQYLFTLDHLGDNFVDTLLGDTLVCAIDANHLPILQQYHLKQPNPNPCVYDPHTMSEALHWGKAIQTVFQLISQHPQFARVAFWEKCYTVVQPLDNTLVTLNLMDVLLSQDNWLLYHAREDVWNDIFAEFVGREQIEHYILHYFTTKQIDLTSLKNRL
ncbi:MAG: hypothetical protein ACD_43C00111G0002 [uncultured bacterium]|nr:MAG: hypothetical protein ACD_43C00111G0002 [uncultured bacterium]